MPTSRSAASAPSTRPAMIWSCHCAATTPTRRSVHSARFSSGAPCPLTLGPPLLAAAWSCRAPLGRRRAGLDGSVELIFAAEVARIAEVGQVMTHPVPLGAQVPQVVRGGRDRYRDPA